MTLILHVGASKCGSSAIQTALSSQPLITRLDGSRLEYMAINHHGHLVRGERLKREAETSGMGYRNSPTAPAIRKMDLASLGRELAAIDHDIILSRERWVFQAAVWKELLAAMDARAHVVAYVRPQVGLLNSAWWQWGAWSDEPFDQWLQGMLSAHMWSQRIAAWSSIDRVESCTVRLVRGDVVSDFFTHVLGAAAPESALAANPSLPGTILRLFQRQRQLRPGPHDSKIEFVLNRHLKLQGETPWVLDQAWIRRILSATEQDNHQLLGFLDDDSAAAMREDGRWWNPEAYSDKKAESPDPIPPDAAELDELCAALITALNKA